jgi:hypothetical protein
MTDSAKTPEAKHADFWAERDAHAKKVAEKLAAVQEEINAGVDAGLYRDGLTANLKQTQDNVLHLANALNPAPLADPAAEPVPIAPARA